jgi:Sec-independent protein translocase protein TatA
MEFLGIGPLELAFIIIIALILIGPRDMAKTARSAGRLLNRLYKSEEWKAITDASRNLRNLPNRLAREAALEDLDLHNEIKETLDEAKQATSLPAGPGMQVRTTPPPASQAQPVANPGSTEVMPPKPPDETKESEEPAPSP